LKFAATSCLLISWVG